MNNILPHRVGSTSSTRSTASLVKVLLLFLLLIVGLVLPQIILPRSANGLISSASNGLDPFGIKEIYPSKPAGEQWNINMQSVTSDPQFSPNGVTLTKNADGTYKVTASQVRLQVFTSTGFQENQITTLNQMQLAAKGYMLRSNDWKNVEMTGYLKANSITTSTQNGAAHIEYVARGARNTNDQFLVGGFPAMCEATTYHSNTYLSPLGRVKFEKDLMHTAGYTANSQDPQKLNSVNIALGKWVGIKAVYYNFPNGTVKLEQWVDDSTDNINAPGNNWHKVLEFTDHDQWGGGHPNCGGTDHTIITWGGPIALFRWDNVDDMDLKNLSIREIQPPSANVWSGWGGLGGNILSNPVVARNSDGRLEVFVIGTDHALYHKSQLIAGGNGWTDYSSLGGNIINNPAVAMNSDGRLEVFVIGTDHALWHIFETAQSSSNSWSGYGSLGGNIISNPAVAMNSDGRLEVFVIGTDHALWHIFETAPSSSNSWSGYGSLGGNIISNPAVAMNSDGRLEVFVIGTDHALWHIFETAPSSSSIWSAFIFLGGYVISDPAVAQNSDGRKQVFVIGSDHALYSISQVAVSSSSWSGYGYLGGTIADNTSPAVALNSDGQLQVFVVGPGNAIFYKFQITPGSSSWTDYVSLGGVVISNPVVATNSDGRLEVFVIGSDQALYHNFRE
jgi:hypothetical protein